MLQYLSNCLLLRYLPTQQSGIFQYIFVLHFESNKVVTHPQECVMSSPGRNVFRNKYVIMDKMMCVCVLTLIFTVLPRYHANDAGREADVSCPFKKNEK